MIRSIYLASIFLAILVLSPLAISSAPIAADDGLLNAAVDRIEEDKAVIILKDGTCIVLPLSVLGSNIREGDCINMAFSVDSPSKEALEKDASLGLGGLLGEPR